MEQTLKDALTYWESKRAGRRMPARRDLDPVLEIPKLVPWVILTDVLRDPLDFRYRLIGSGIVDRSRRNYTGKLFSELPHIGPDSFLWKQRATIVETGAPLRCEPPYVGQTPKVCRVADMHLPLSNDGETVNMIFTVAVFHNTPRTSDEQLRGAGTLSLSGARFPLDLDYAPCQRGK